MSLSAHRLPRLYRSASIWETVAPGPDHLPADPNHSPTRSRGFTLLWDSARRYDVDAGRPLSPPSPVARSYSVARRLRGARRRRINASRPASVA